MIIIANIHWVFTVCLTACVLEEQLNLMERLLSAKLGPKCFTGFNSQQPYVRRVLAPSPFKREKNQGTERLSTCPGSHRWWVEASECISRWSGLDGCTPNHSASLPLGSVLFLAVLSLESHGSLFKHIQPPNLMWALPKEVYLLISGTYFVRLLWRLNKILELSA